MNFFDQNSAPAISGHLANYAFRPEAHVPVAQTGGEALDARVSPLV